MNLAGEAQRRLRAWKLQEHPLEAEGRRLLDVAHGIIKTILGTALVRSLHVTCPACGSVRVAREEHFTTGEISWDAPAAVFWCRHCGHTWMAMADD